MLMQTASTSTSKPAAYQLAITAAPAKLFMCKLMNPCKTTRNCTGFMQEDRPN